MSRKISKKAAVNFLEEAASYFEGRETGGEDSAHWANVYNAENCRAIASVIESGSLSDNTVGSASAPR